MSKSVRWLVMTRIEQYRERERVIDLVNEIGIHYAWKRGDVSETCYRTVTRMRYANDLLASVIANEAGR